MQNRIRPLLVVTTMLLASLAWAQPPVEEKARGFAWDDPQLEWGPCPPFLPKGCGIAVLHGDPAQPNVDVFFKVPGGAKIASHWHSSAERMVLVSGTLDVTYAGEATHTLESGMYAYGPAKKAHVASCRQGAPCVLFIAFESPLDAFPTEQAAH